MAANQVTSDAPAKNNSDLEPSSSAIDVRQLNYTFPDGTIGLKDINLSVPAGSRVLLIGGM